MTKNRKNNNAGKFVSAICMILALLWLTVSLPVVYASQQQIAKQEAAGDISCCPISATDEDANPFGNTTEEKSPGNGISVSEEYLHDHHSSEHFFFEALQFHKCENASTYVAFHGELLVPPPNVA